MQLEIPYLYFATFLEKGKRVPRGAYLRETNPVVVHVPETDSLSAPPAMDITYRTYDPAVPVKTMSLRTFGGRLWKRLTRDNGRGDLPGTPMSMDDFARMAARSIHDDWWSKGDPMLHCVHPDDSFADHLVGLGFPKRDGKPYIRVNGCYPRSGPHRTKKDLDADRMLKDNNLTVRAYVKRILSRYLVVDGVVWTTASEPVWGIFRGGLGSNHGSTYLRLLDDYHPNLPWHCHFRADRMAEAMEHGGRLALARGDTDSVRMVGGIPVVDDCCGTAVTVHLPFALARDPRKDHDDGDPLINGMLELTETIGSKDPFLAGIACAMKA